MARTPKPKKPAQTGCALLVAVVLAVDRVVNDALEEKGRSKSDEGGDRYDEEKEEDRPDVRTMECEHTLERWPGGTLGPCLHALVTLMFPAAIAVFAATRASALQRHSSGVPSMRNVGPSGWASTR